MIEWTVPSLVTLFKIANIKSFCSLMVSSEEGLVIMLSTAMISDCTAALVH